MEIGKSRLMLWKTRGSRLTRVTGVGIGLGFTLGNFEGVLVDDLIEGAFTTAENLAGPAVAMDLLPC